MASNRLERKIIQNIPCVPFSCRTDLTTETIRALANANVMYPALRKLLQG